MIIHNKFIMAPMKLIISSKNGDCDVDFNIDGDPLFIGGIHLTIICKHYHHVLTMVILKVTFLVSLNQMVQNQYWCIWRYGRSGTNYKLILMEMASQMIMKNSIDCLDPNDADTDDDGILDGNEDKRRDGIIDPDESNPCLADTDSDGIYDGTEVGLTEPQNIEATNLLIGHFVADSNPSTVTSPNNADTDNDGIPDGLEDVNHNGSVDTCEPDPSIQTVDVPVDLDDDGDVDGNDLAEHAKLIDLGTFENCTEVIPAYLGVVTLPADPDGDGILSDGDYSGVVGDYPCPDSVTMNCDDNCTHTSNAGQEDLNANGIGDACDL
jgi:hypothetical protein